MRSAVPLVCLLACCAMPPRVDDRSTPVRAYETFRGAIARAEYVREWSCLSDDMRSSMGMRDRGDWQDARAVVLTQSHILVKGICRSTVDSEQQLPDGRVQLELDFPLGYEGRVVMAPVVVLRAFVGNDTEPRIYEILPELKLEKNERGLVIPIPPKLRKWLDVAGPFRKVEVAVEWFLDDFSAGDETPQSVRADLDKNKGQ